MVKKKLNITGNIHLKSKFQIVGVVYSIGIQTDFFFHNQEELETMLKSDRRSSHGPLFDAHIFFTIYIRESGSQNSNQYNLHSQLELAFVYGHFRIHLLGFMMDGRIIQSSG